MNAGTSLWALLLHPQGSDLLPPARSHIMARTGGITPRVDHRKRLQGSHSIA